MYNCKRAIRELDIEMNEGVSAALCVSLCKQKIVFNAAEYITATGIKYRPIIARAEKSIERVECG